MGRQRASTANRVFQNHNALTLSTRVMNSQDKTPPNLFDAMPERLEAEVFVDLLRAPQVRIERIVSKGHTSPDHGWYDQDENEWVMVLQGCGVIAFDDGTTIRLSAGDYLNIPAHCKHRVAWTDPQQLTVWLAVFYR